MTSLRSLAFLPAFGALACAAESPAAASAGAWAWASAGVESVMRLFSRAVRPAGHQGGQQPVRGPLPAADARRDADAVVDRAAHAQTGQLADVLADAGDP